MRRAPAGLLLGAVGASAADSRAPVVTRGMAEVAEPKIYYETAGTGPAVILIHGGQMDRRIWDDQFLAFASKGFQVVRYDVRGYGKSEVPSKPFSHVKDLLALLDSAPDREGDAGGTLAGRTDRH